MAHLIHCQKNCLFHGQSTNLTKSYLMPLLDIFQLECIFVTKLWWQRVDVFFSYSIVAKRYKWLMLLSKIYLFCFKHHILNMLMTLIFAQNWAIPCAHENKEHPTICSSKNINFYLPGRFFKVNSCWENIRITSKK